MNVTAADYSHRLLEGFVEVVFIALSIFSCDILSFQRFFSMELMPFFLFIRGNQEQLVALFVIFLNRLILYFSLFLSAFFFF
jgi:hypothetical protein